jgi:hypothetical protein
MKQRLIILGMWVLVLTTLSSFLAPLRASAAVPAGIDGTLVFADGEANAHEGAPGFALAWVEHAFNVSGVPVGAASAWTYYVALGKPNDGANPEGVPRGALVFFSGSGGDGHVGIALGDGQMISDLNIPGIKTGVYKGPLSEGGTLAGWAWPPADWPGRPELAGTSNVFVPTIPIPPLATAALVATKLAAALPTAVKPAVALPRATTTTPRYGTTTTPRYGTTSTTPLLTRTSTILGVTPDSLATSGTTETLTARVTPTAAGTVRFNDSGTNLGTATVSGGTATVNPTLASGTHSLTAVFTPTDPNAFTTSTSNTVPYTVNPAPVPTTTTTTTPAQPLQQQQATQQQGLQQQTAQQQTLQQQTAQQQALQQQAAQQQAAHRQAQRQQALQQQQQAAQQQALQQQALQQQALQQQALQQQALQQQALQQQAAQQQALEQQAQQAAQQSAAQQSRSGGR